MSNLIDFWPSLGSINHCIRTEAETLDDAVLLAVHESTPLKVREVGTGTEQPRTERDLLDALLAPADDGSAVVVAITGDSGVGKSHMIRWLNAQLQRHENRDRLVIVLVPKTASLRQVVELIIAPLEGEEFERLRNELARATDTLSPESASQMLATALAIELKSLEKQLLEDLKSGENHDRSKRERARHAGGLQTILFQVGTFDQWLQKVLLRIVGQALKGGSEATSGELRRFVPDDLVLPENFDITTLSRDAQLYIQHLQSNGGAATRVAAGVLQDVLDPALRSVFRFSEALGQRTLEEIVNDIRARLLQDGDGGKELVLLIEDFAALAGIQESLLSLMISESDYGGRRVRAPLRTALAVTDGFLPSRQTILTRAKREWVIPNAGISDDEVVQRLICMAGRYLNAARWGQTALREQFDSTIGQDLGAWVSIYNPELDDREQECLSAFGESANGHPLFPLSPAAVNALARREMTVDGKLLFNPRKFINSVLRDVLLKREGQEKGQFPPPNFKGATLKTDADLDLGSQGRDANVRQRLIPALAFWAGDPRNLSDPPLVRQGVFSAFGLPWPFQYQSPYEAPTDPTPERGRQRPGRTPVSPAAEPPSDSLPPSGPTVRNPVTPGLEGDLDNWATGALKQARANRLRTVLEAALGYRMDWNSLRMAHGLIKKEFFWLPYAQVGNPTGAPKLVVAPEIRPVPATVRRALVALDRWYDNANSWDYPRAEEDYAYAQALLDQLEEQARAHFVQRAEREAAILGRTLYRQALLLGLATHARSDKPELFEMLASAEPIQTTDALRQLPNLTQILTLQERAIQTRGALAQLYLEKISCFQGDGAKTYAVDSGRVLSAWMAVEEANEASQIRFDDMSLSSAVSEWSSSRMQLAVTRYGNVVRAFRTNLITLTGTDLNETLPATLRAVLSRATMVGVLANKGINITEVDAEIAWLETPEALNLFLTLRVFEEPAEEDSPQVQLAVWASVNLVQLGRAQLAVNLISNLLSATKRNAAAQLQAEGGSNVTEKMGQLITSLSSLKDTQ